MRTRVFFPALSLILTLALTACPSPAPTVTSLALTAPTGPIKRGATATLTARALDAGGQEVLGQSVTWTSSDPDIASVSSGGVVTAKALGSVKITAALNTVKAETSITTYGLEVVGGTYLADATLGTALTYRARSADGQQPPAGTILKITGPSGWRPGKPPVQLPLGAPLPSGLRTTGLYKSTPVTGSYNAEMTLGADTFSTTFEIDASKSVAIATDLTFSNLSATGLNATWVAPAGSFPLEVDVVEDPAKTYLYLLEQKATVNSARLNVALSAAKTYQLEVYLTDVDMTADNPKFPAQLNLSINYRTFTLPTAP